MTESLVVLMSVVLTAAVLGAQTAPKKAAARPSKPSGTLAQVMRGVYFPNANLIFDVQQRDPAAPPAPKANDAAGSATSTYGNAYSGWEIVENAAVALTDGVDLILAPGRLCQNGKPVPVAQADFQKFAPRYARRRTRRCCGGADQEPGKGLRRDQRPGRRLRELPRGLPRQGSRRERRALHAAEVEPR